MRLAGCCHRISLGRGEWEEWHRVAQPRPVSQARWLEQMLAHPELVVLVNMAKAPQ